MQITTNYIDRNTFDKAMTSLMQADQVSIELLASLFDMVYYHGMCTAIKAASAQVDNISKLENTHRCADTFPK